MSMIVKHYAFPLLFFQNVLVVVDSIKLINNFFDKIRNVLEVIFDIKFQTKLGCHN
jgi:hypothetical protein